MARPAVRTALAGLCMLLATTVAGCTKPTPEVTLQTGGTTVRSAPLRYELGSQHVNTGRGPKVLRVRPGANINISVDKTTADAGWVVLFGGQQNSPLLTGGQHHFAFPAPAFADFRESTLAIYQQPPNGGPAAGVWLFTLQPAD